MRRSLISALLVSVLALPACNLASQSRVESIQRLNDGVKQLKNKNYVRAESIIQDAIKVDPNHARAYAALGRAYREQGKWPEMSKAYADAVRTAEEGDPAAEYAYQQGYALEQLGLEPNISKEERVSKFNDAIRSYQDALTRMPNNPKAHYHVGFLYEKLDQPEQADKAYRAAIAADSTYSLAYVALGNMYIDYGFSNVAMAVLDTGTKVNNTDAAMWNGLGRALLNLNRGKDAIDAYKKAKAIDPSMPDVLFGLGMAYAEMRMRAENLEEFLQKAGANAPAHVQKSANDTLARMQDVI